MINLAQKLYFTKNGVRAERDLFEAAARTIGKCIAVIYKNGFAKHTSNKTEVTYCNASEPNTIWLILTAGHFERIKDWSSEITEHLNSDLYPSEEWTCQTQLKGESTKEMIDRQFALVTAMATEAEKGLPDNIRDQLESERIRNFEQQ